jgi:hypothetical protein
MIETTLQPVPGFDFLVGDWQVHNRRLRRPLTGDGTWYETSAVATSRTLHQGAISVDEMWFAEEGFAGSSIRLHDPATDEWTIHWVNSRDGHLQPPVTGRWAEDEFVGEGPDRYDDRAIVARYRWWAITPESAVWEQSFSLDGVAWETNWVMTWRRA